MGRGSDWLSEHAWLSVERLWDIVNMLRRASQTKKNRFSADTVPRNGLIGKEMILLITLKVVKMALIDGLSLQIDYPDVNQHHDI